MEIIGKNNAIFTEKHRESLRGIESSKMLSLLV